MDMNFNLSSINSSKSPVSHLRSSMKSGHSKHNLIKMQSTEGAFLKDLKNSLMELDEHLEQD